MTTATSEMVTTATMLVVPASPVTAPAAPLSLRELSAELELRRQLVEAGDEIATQRQHDKGKLTARERLELLLDDGSFQELDLFVRHRPGDHGLGDRRPETDGVVTGTGTIDGRTVCVFAHDFRLFGGSLGEAFAEKIVKVMDLAASLGAPMIGINDGGGARIQEGISALDGFGKIFRRNVALSGVVPQISIVAGPCAGGAVYSPALTDFVFVVRDLSNMYITGPDVIESVTGERVTHEELGGATTHATRSGVAHFIVDDEQECFEQVRLLVSLLPDNNGELPPTEAVDDPVDRTCDALLDLVPADGSKSYDVRKVIAEIVDDALVLEVHQRYARNVVCCLARLGGAVVGIVANQPCVMAGALDIAASEKAARFVRTCDAFNIALVTLIDVPGFLPGTDQEHRGIIRHGAKLLYAYCEATVPRVSVVLRKAFGGAYIVMDSKSVGCDATLAWPSNEIAVMGAAGASRIVFRRELAAATDPAAKLDELAASYRERLMHPLIGAERGLVDALINPVDTRRVLITTLRRLVTKREQQPQRKHANEPF